MKKNKKIIIISIFITFLFISIFDRNILISKSIAKDSEQTIQYSKDYQHYLELSDEEKKQCAIIPRMYDIPLSALDTNKASKSSIAMKTKNELPSEFNLANKVKIKVECQTTSTCWNYATMKSLETNVAIATGEVYDFSERHLDYMTSNLFGGERKAGTGGNFVTAINYLEPYGAVLEEDIANREYLESEYDELINAHKIKEVVKSIEFPSIWGDKTQYTDEEIKKFRDTIKSHIMSYGSIYANVDIHGHFNTETASLYVEEGFVNHAISIVGWDDNYSKDNFLEGYKPSKDGAYIALNSWGENWGNGGYFYISYEDCCVESSMGGIISSRDTDEINIYYHSNRLDAGYIETIGIGNLDVDNPWFTSPYFANIFDNDQEDTYLSKISFLSNTIGTREKEFSYQIYVNPIDSSLNSENFILVKSENNVVNPVSNFTTVYLDTPIQITGNKFAIVVKYISDGYINYIREDGTNNYTYTSTDLNNNWQKNESIFTNINTGEKSVENIPIMAYTTKGIKLDLGKTNQYITMETDETIDIPVYTSKIPNDSKLTINIRNKSGDVTDDFIIKGKIINNNTTTISISAPNRIPLGIYIVDISYSDTPLKSKVFTLLNNENATFLGDVYIDGIINLKDLVILKRHLAEVEEYKLIGQSAKNADVNDDGVIDEEDVKVLTNYINEVQGYENLPKIYECGDINRDYTVNTADVTYLGKYLNGNTNYPVLTKLADVNGDGEVDWKDYGILKKHIEEETEYENLPKVYEYGDINRDYVVNATDITYLGRNLNGNTNYPVVTKIADVNDDGQIDWKDYSILKKHISGETGYETLPKLYECGDINRDYVVNATDITYLGRNLNGNTNYVVIEKITDVNEDGVIDWNDYRVLKKHMAEEAGYETLPKAYPCGDVNRDYEVNVTDVTYLGRYLNGREEYKIIVKLTDTNNDGQVDWNDYKVLKSYLNNVKGYTILPIIK